MECFKSAFEDLVLKWTLMEILVKKKQENECRCVKSKQLIYNTIHKDWKVILKVILYFHGFLNGYSFLLNN